MFLNPGSKMSTDRLHFSSKHRQSTEMCFQQCQHHRNGSKDNAACHPAERSFQLNGGHWW